MNKQTFIQGTMILLVAGIVNRLLGFIPRIMLPRVIGAEGVGLYQLGYPFFLVLVTIITGGIPLAVAKLVAEAESSGKPERSVSILRTSLVFTTAAGFLFTFLCLFGAPWVTRYVLTDPRVYHTFIAMCPMIIIVSVSSVYRGYFQGKQDMIPSAVSSIMETVARIIGVLWFSYLLLPMGIAYAAAGAMLGVVAGEVVGMGVLLWQYRRLQRRERLGGSMPGDKADDPAHTGTHDESSASVAYPFGATLRRILRIAIPVTGSRLVGSLSYLLESITTARSLAIAGIGVAVATSQYGALQGMIIPLLLLPGALTSSLAVSLVPSLAEAQARGDVKTIHLRLHQSLRLALVTGAPFAAIMFVLAEPICRLVYNDAAISGMLKIMAPFALLLYIQTPLQATLQALDKPGRALVNTLVGAIIKISLIFYLASNPALGIYGAIIAIIINFVVVTVMHGYSVSKTLRYRLPYLDMLKVGAAMVIMAAAADYLYKNFILSSQMGWQFLMAALLSGLLYLALAGIMGLFDLQDLKRLPVFGKWFRR
ncbi:polysaccharide biosynthesis protein [Paenibacillus timonensis]|uniref:Oligosaccharide flippase family protein n=1 Tax=Paenibacillus timonensis TaxID=225915 RepID=A0ABW3SB04_9BACL|nr:polysaccharide biosynthesis protein [Paenibacillus timonensis]MCH1640438.1 polysaccharide biosynthesis protein [Paenibacillus timonensis]